MKFLANSPNPVFTRRLQSYAQEKLQKPLVRHKFDSENVAMRVDAEKIGNRVQLKVVVMIPGEANQHISCTDDELNAAIDMASDKLERLLSDLSDKKQSMRRTARNAADFSEPLGDDDYLTDGEEEALRAMNALDDVLDL
ncbi:MAG: HPF/RaiA family ribosome-associated protein [Myxococcota bacterium]|nr:HPF/RaiA family ribosome-associated protein [Myxococcota bacterium]